MDQVKIICPNCKKLFSANEALKNILREKEQKYLEELKVKEKLLEEKFKLNLKLKERGYKWKN